MGGPQRVSRILLGLVVYVTIFFDRWEYSKAAQINPDSWMDVIRGTAPAPQQYRIGVERVGGFLLQHAHLALRHTFTLIDAVCAVIAVYLLLALFERSQTYRTASEARRWFGAAAFLFLVQYYFVWVAWYQKPETFATVAVLTITVWLMQVRLPLRGAASIVATSAAMLALAAVQALIRPDVIFAVHLGILLICLTRWGGGFAIPRAAQAATSLFALVLACGIQYYLMHVVYPHASYGTSPVFELVLNFKLPVRWLAFIPFMAPTAWMMATLVRRRDTLAAPAAALATGAVIYVAMWFLVGCIDEVRIFLPYAVALVPLTCACAMQRFLPAEDAPGTL